MARPMSAVTGPYKIGQTSHVDWQTADSVDPGLSLFYRG